MENLHPPSEITVEYARQKLGESANGLSDLDILKLINLLRSVSNKVIDSTIESKYS